MAVPSPLPVRRGVNATRLRVPTTGPWATIHDYVLETFGHIDHGGITARFLDGEVVDAGGHPLTTSTALGSVEYLWYYRSVAHEDPLPVTEHILFEDDHLLVVDKPHFLPTTPAGRYVQESLLVRLRNRLGIDDLVPMHRLDRGTAGVVLFSKTPKYRGAYQVLFERHQVHKSYQCVSVLPHGSSLREGASVIVRNRLLKTKGVLTSYGAAYEPYRAGTELPVQGGRAARRRLRDDPSPRANAESKISLVRAFDGDDGTSRGLFNLVPRTGKTHQLRYHLAMLGLGIMHDRFYPELLPDSPDDFSQPLQLLASDISFIDPLSKEPRHFHSQRELIESSGSVLADAQGPIE